MTNYAAKQASATKTILAKGALATLEHDVPTTPSFVTDTPTPPSTVQGTVRLVALPFKLRNAASDQTEAGTEVLNHQRRIILSPFDLTMTPLAWAPIVGDRVLNWEGKTWTINGLSPLAPDSAAVVLYTGTMRQ